MSVSYHQASQLEGRREAALPASSSQRNEELFVVRLWREQQAPSRSWRGSVEHVGSKRRYHFSNLSDLIDFIRLRLTEDG
jgi:hypothetical protein